MLVLEQQHGFSITCFPRSQLSFSIKHKTIKLKNMASSSQSSATAGVLRDFLPVFDKLNELRGKYGEDSFGSAYKELTLQNTFANLGVTDYNVQPGEPVNNFRMKVLEREMSTEFAKDTIIRQTVPGLELDGNVIRAASCVASSGSGDAKGEGTE